jgi:hypothetical protein
MIRDPSDGSVREKRPDSSDLSRPPMTGEIPAMTSALSTPPKDAKEAARLEKSRKFVRDYHAGKRSPEQGEG